MLLDSGDVIKLLDFVDEGNTAFISSKTLPFELMEELYFEYCGDYYWNDYVVNYDTGAILQLRHPNLFSDSSFHYNFFNQNGPAALPLALY